MAMQQLAAGLFPQIGTALCATASASDSEEPAGQLYNLTKDPSEQNNLWNEMPGKVKALRVLLEAEKANKKNDRNLR